MDDAGFIIGSYVVTFLAVIGFGWATLRRARRLGKKISQEETYWT
jgi:heme exporter protein CcmD